MNIVAEKPLTIVWKFYYFRRHLDKETLDCIRYVWKYDDMGRAFDEIVASAGDGMCCIKCLPCGAYIFGDQALGGIVVMATAEAVTGAMHRIMAPLCKTCAHKDLDILATKCVEYMSTDMFKNAVVQVLPLQQREDDA